MTYVFLKKDCCMMSSLKTHNKITSHIKVSTSKAFNLGSHIRKFIKKFEIGQLTEQTCSQAAPHSSHSASYSDFRAEPSLESGSEICDPRPDPTRP